MTVKDFVEAYAPKDITFIKARARKDAHTPYYHAEYQTTCIYNSWNMTSMLDDYLVLNDRQAPVDWLSGAQWGLAFSSGRLESLLIISTEDLVQLYGHKQAKSMIDYIDAEIRRRRR